MACDVVNTGMHLYVIELLTSEAAFGKCAERPKLLSNSGALNVVIQKCALSDDGHPNATGYTTHPMAKRSVS